MRKLYHINEYMYGSYKLIIVKSLRGFKWKDLKENGMPQTPSDPIEGYTVEVENNDIIITRLYTQYSFVEFGISNNTSSRFYNKYEKVLKQHIKNAVKQEPAMSRQVHSIKIGTKYTIPKIIFDIEEEKHELKLLL